MLIFSTVALVPRATAKQVTDFFINCNSLQYQKWWPEMHYEFYTISRFKNNLGNIVYMNEIVGQYHLKFKARVTKYDSGKIIEYQMIKGCLLPAWVKMEFKDIPDGALVNHTLRVGYNGIGKFFDFFLKLYLSNSFEEQLEGHAKNEFIRLGEII